MLDVPEHPIRPGLAWCLDLRAERHAAARRDRLGKRGSTFFPAHDARAVGGEPVIREPEGLRQRRVPRHSTGVRDRHPDGARPAGRNLQAIGRIDRCGVPRVSALGGEPEEDRLARVGDRELDHEEDGDRAQPAHDAVHAARAIADRGHHRKAGQHRHQAGAREGEHGGLRHRQQRQQDEDRCGPPALVDHQCQQGQRPGEQHLEVHRRDGRVLEGAARPHLVADVGHERAEGRQPIAYEADAHEVQHDEACQEGTGHGRDHAQRAHGGPRGDAVDREQVHSQRRAQDDPTCAGRSRGKQAPRPSQSARWPAAPSRAR